MDCAVHMGGVPLMKKTVLARVASLGSKPGRLCRYQSFSTRLGSSDSPCTSRSSLCS